MDKSESLLNDIARIEKDIEDFLEYRSELFAGGPALTGWAAFVAGFKRRMAARQALRHLQYLRLEREITRQSFENLRKIRGEVSLKEIHSSRSFPKAPGTQAACKPAPV